MFLPIPLEFKYAGTKSSFPAANARIGRHQRAGLPVWAGTGRWDRARAR